MFRPLRVEDSHEDLFVARYAKLLAWARQIVGGDRDAVESNVRRRRTEDRSSIESSHRAPLWKPGERPRLEQRVLEGNPALSI